MASHEVKATSRNYDGPTAPHMSVIGGRPNNRPLADHPPKGDTRQRGRSLSPHSSPLLSGTARQIVPEFTGSFALR